MSDYCDCYELGATRCTCGKPRADEPRSRQQVDAARHKGYNAGLTVGAERERARLISRLATLLLHPNLTLSKKDEIELYIAWLNGGGK